MKDTDKERYIEAWDNHINELSSIGYPLMEVNNDHFEELIKIQSDLRKLIKIAADNDFKDAE